MRRLIVVRVLLPLAALSLVAVLPSRSAPALDEKSVTARALDNGLRVIVKSEHATNLVAIGLYVRAGPLTEQGWPEGISRFVEALLFEGPDEGKAAKVRERLAVLGGHFSSNVTRDFTHAHVAVASASLQPALEMLSELVTDRAFPPTAVHDVRQSLLRDLRMEQTDPRAIQLRMVDRLWALAYERHPYGNALRGTVDSVAQVTAEQAAQYYAQLYVPGNMALLVVGDVTPGEAVAGAAGTLGRLPRKELRWQRPEPEPPQTETRTDTITVAAPRHAFMMAFHAPGIADKREVCAMDLIYTVLGQGDRSRLLRVLRDEGKVALTAEVEFITHREPGLFIVTCVAAEEQELAARRGVLQELQHLADEPLSAQELTDAKKLLRDSYAFSNETLMDQTGSMGFYECIDTYQFALDYIAEVNKVTAKDIQAVARRYLRPDVYSIVVARPEASQGVREASL